MNELTLAKRMEIRSALEHNRRHREPTAGRFTDLGMYFIDVDDTPVLVAVEINVPRLLAVVQKRLVKSKSGRARLANGSVRLSIATADGREVCHSAITP